jgi:hypothetical protein
MDEDVSMVKRVGVILVVTVLVAALVWASISVIVIRG